MLFLEFLIIYFICIDTPIYDQPLGYQGTVLVIPLLRFYLFLLYPQQEGWQDLCQGGWQWDGLIPSLPPHLMASFHGHLLATCIPPWSPTAGCKDSPPTQRLHLLFLSSCWRPFPGSSAPEGEGGAHTWAWAPSLLQVLWHVVPKLFSFGISIWGCVLLLLHPRSAPWGSNCCETSSSPALPREQQPLPF